MHIISYHIISHPSKSYIISIQFHVCRFSTTSCTWTTNATCGMICRSLLDFDKKVFVLRTTFCRAGLLSLLRGNRASIGRRFTRFVRKFCVWIELCCLCSGAITFSHKIQTSHLCRCRQVRFDLHIKHDLCTVLRSPGASSEKDDRIRELEIMVRSLEEKLTR